MPRFFLLIILLAASVIQAQNTAPGITIDSLNKAAEKNLTYSYSEALRLSDKAHQLAVSNNQAKAQAESDYVKAAVMANTNQCRPSLKLADKLLANADDKILTAKLYSVKATCYYSLALYDSCTYLHEKAIDLLTGAGNSTLLAEEYNYLAKNLVKCGNVPRALQCNEKATRLLGPRASGAPRALCLDVLSEICQVQRLFDKAISTGKESIKLYGNHNNAGRSSSALHIANCYYLLIKDDSAKLYYQVALQGYEQLGDTNGVAICCSNLSRIFLEAGNHKNAISYANKALSLVQHGGYKIVEAATLQHLGDIYADLKQYASAVGYVNQALALAEKFNQKAVEKDCHKSLSEIYTAMKQPAQAYDHLLLAYRLKDSLQPILLNRQLAEMQAKYETEKKESQIKTLQQNNYIKTLELKDREEEIRGRNLVIALCVLVFLIAGLIVYFLRQRQRLENRLATERAVKQSEENERMRIAKDIHDELGSGLSKIRFLSELAGSENAGIKQQQSLQSISQTSTSLVENMRDLIWTMNPENTTLDSLVARIREYSYDYLEEFPVELETEFPENVPAQKVTKEISRNVFMIVKESLQNVVKHAGASKVSLLVLVNGYLKIVIKDNGKGFDARLKSEGNGLHNMQARSTAIGAHLTIQSGPGTGTELVLELPLITDPEN